MHIDIATVTCALRGDFTARALSINEQNKQPSNHLALLPVRFGASHIGVVFVPSSARESIGYYAYVTMMVPHIRCLDCVARSHAWPATVNKAHVPGNEQVKTS